MTNFKIQQEQKQKYRIFFKQCRSFINFSPFLAELNISPSNFSKFLNNENSYVSLVKLRALYISIRQKIRQIIERDIERDY